MSKIGPNFSEKSDMMELLREQVPQKSDQTQTLVVKML